MGGFIRKYVQRKPKIFEQQKTAVKQAPKGPTAET